MEDLARDLPSNFAAGCIRGGRIVIEGDQGFSAGVLDLMRLVLADQKKRSLANGDARALADRDARAGDDEEPLLGFWMFVAEFAAHLARAQSHHRGLNAWGVQQ